jgi:hypothetical protein
MIRTGAATGVARGAEWERKRRGQMRVGCSGRPSRHSAVAGCRARPGRRGGGGDGDWRAGAGAGGEVEVGASPRKSREGLGGSRSGLGAGV